MNLARLLAPDRREQLAGILDQGVVSLGNLAVGLFVLRIAAKEEYGLYGLSYMTLILLNGFGAALFAGQMTVSIHPLPPAERAPFAAAVLAGQWTLTGALGLGAALLAAVLPWADETRLLVALTALACPLAMTHDYLRSYFFVVQRAAVALALDAALIALWGALTAGFAFAAGLAPHLAALAALGCATLATSAAGLWCAGLPMTQARARIAATLRAIWPQGRWAMGGAGVSAVQNQAHVYLLGWLASASAVADLNAARMLLTPMSLLLMGTNRSFVPQMARLMAEGRTADVHRRSANLLGGLLVVILCYSVAVWFGRDWIVGELLRKSYAGIGPLVGLWAVVLMLQAADNNYSAVLQVSHRFRFLTTVNGWTAVPVVIAAVPMILWLGAAGSLLTLMAGYAALTFLLWRDFQRVTRAQGAPA